MNKHLLIAVVAAFALAACSKEEPKKPAPAPTPPPKAEVKKEEFYAAEDSIDTWRQWTYRWDATKGDHRIQARAYDRSGTPQTADEAPPAPDGATGYPTRTVTVG